MRRNAPVEFSLPSFGSCPLTMWFRNLQIFRLTSDWAYSTDALSAALQLIVWRVAGCRLAAKANWCFPSNISN
jgi:DNA recombination-dependent growth factor C